MACGDRGYTLLELLIAIVVTALIAAGGYAGLSAISRASAAHRQQVQELEQVQWLVARLDRDLFHAINRPVRVDSLERAALVGNSTALSFTHGGLANPLGQARSELQRVDWVLQGQDLYRYTRLQLDGPATPGAAELLLQDVSALSIQFLGTGNQWHADWPLAAEDGLPRAVRYQLQIDGFGVLERLIELPGERS